VDERRSDGEMRRWGDREIGRWGNGVGDEGIKLKTGRGGMRRD
jgi:hypothetical protein